MGLGLTPRAHLSAVRFPPSSVGVSLPRDSRGAAAAGITMYTASKPTALAIQWLAWLWVRTAGPRLLPGPRETIDRGYYLDVLAATGLRLLPDVTVACYRRRDAVRSGDTFIAHDGVSSVLVKVRDDAAALAAEQQMLEKVLSASPRTFSVPPPLGHGLLADGRGWSAQKMIFSAPHRPCLRVTADVLADLGRVLDGAVAPAPTTHPTWLPAHGDLTPWNVRLDLRGRLWIFDWEDAGLAPPGTDAAYFAAALGLIRPRRPMPRVRPEVADYLSQRIQERLEAGHPREGNQLMLDRLNNRSEAAPAEHRSRRDEE